ncbi:MAG: efflux RND transporter periplasmic adaptor subunit [Rhodospirillaceae bacterium]|nr:efflux RND transporter periplasmic adaptor subunit [Rhodospirillales bacterium]
MYRRRFRRLPVLLLLAAIVVGAGYVISRSGTRDVELVKPFRGQAVEAVYATGVVEPEQWAKIAALAPGRIAEIFVREGDVVRQGQALARLDDREARARVAELEAKAAYWREQMTRSKALAERGIRSQDAFEKDKSELDQVNSAIAAARQRRSDLVVTSPIDGTVLRRDFELGEVVGLNDALFWIGAPRPLRITADVDEEDIPRVAPGQKVLIKADAFPDRVLEARVSRITPKGDPINKTFRVRVALPDDTPLLVGMTTEVNIVTAEKADALLVAASALVGGQLFVVRDGEAVLRPVTIGIRGRKAIEVLDGVGPDDQVIANPPAGLKPGERVRAK